MAVLDDLEGLAHEAPEGEGQEEEEVGDGEVAEGGAAPMQVD